MTSADASLPAQDLLRQGFPDQDAESAALQRQLVRAAQTLFDGSLADLAEDIARRQDGRPYLFAADFAHGEAALPLIQRLQDYERDSGVVLASVLQEDV